MKLLGNLSVSEVGALCDSVSPPPGGHSRQRGQVQPSVPVPVACQEDSALGGGYGGQEEKNNLGTISQVRHLVF